MPEARMPFPALETFEQVLQKPRFLIPGKKSALS